MNDMEPKQSKDKEAPNEAPNRVRRDSGRGKPEMTEPGTGDRPYEQGERGVGPEKDGFSPSPGPDQG